MNTSEMIEYRGRIDSRLLNDIYNELYHNLNETERIFYGALRTELPSRVSLVDLFLDSSQVEVVIYQLNQEFRIINTGSKYKLVVRPDNEGNIVSNWEKKPVIITISEKIKSFASWIDGMINVLLSSPVVLELIGGIHNVFISPLLQYFGRGSVGRHLKLLWSYFG